MLRSWESHLFLFIFLKCFTALIFQYYLTYHYLDIEMNILKRRRSYSLNYLLFALSLTAGFCSHAYAADSDWPKKPIVAILSFPAGGSTDIFARSVAAPLGDALGQSVIIENKPGAGGMIGLQAAAKAAPDGYTIHISALTNQTISQALFTNPPADLRKDFAPVAQLGSIPHLLLSLIHI